MDLETHPIVEAARDWLVEHAGSNGGPTERSTEISGELDRLAVAPLPSLQRLCALLAGENGDEPAAEPGSGAADDEHIVNDEYRSVLEEVARIVHSAPGAAGAVALLRDAHIVLLGGSGPETVELVRKETRQIRQLLGGMLRQSRACGDHDEARAIRAQLYGLGVREVARAAASPGR